MAKSNRKKRQSKVTPARVAALTSLDLFDAGEGYIRQIVSKVVRSSDMKTEDKSFAMNLSLGVISFRGVLNELIDSVLKDPHDIKDDVRRCLQISTYELFFLDKDVHAAVDQGVELVRYNNPKATGVVNYALRRLSEKRDDFPFGDPSSDNAALARMYGFPRWLTERFIEELGRSNAEKLMKQSNMPSQLYFMVNTLRAQGPKVIEALMARGFSIVPVSYLNQTPHAFPTFICKERHLVGDPLFASLLQEGAIIVSDWAAQEIVRRSLPSNKPTSMLEIGAGRGTKTVMIQVGAHQLYHQQLQLDCLDSNPSRLSELKKRVAKAGISVHEVIHDDAKTCSQVSRDSYDVVFIDAPCSGTGTLDKHPEIRWNSAPQEIESLSRIQRDILTSASGKVSSEGRLVYATCSALRQENEDIVNDFLSSDEGKAFSVVPIGVDEHDYFFSFDTSVVCDIHFCAVLEKN